MVHQVIALRKRIPDSNTAYLSQNILELARLYQSGNEFTIANIEFANAIPLLENLNMRTLAPIGYANLLERYAKTLRASGNINKSKQIQKTIYDLRVANPNTSGSFRETSYPSGCNK